MKMNIWKLYLNKRKKDRTEKSMEMINRIVKRFMNLPYEVRQGMYIQSTLDVYLE